MVLVEEAVKADDFAGEKKKRLGVALLGGLPPAGEEQGFLEGVERPVFFFLTRLSRKAEGREQDEQEERYSFSHDSRVSRFFFYHSAGPLSKIVTIRKTFLKNVDKTRGSKVFLG